MATHHDPCAATQREMESDGRRDYTPLYCASPDLLSFQTVFTQKLIVNFTNN